MLSEDDKAMLDFEKQWWIQPRIKRQMIRDQFGLDPIRYYQKLSRLIDTPEALEYDPIVVHRLVARRDGQA